MKKYILDTDIGDDIDDALALYVALTDNLNLTAITTVYKNTKERALIACKILSYFNKKIPVYAGCGEPLSGSVSCDERTCQYTPDLYEGKYKYDGESEDAIDCIISSAEKYEKDLYLLCIGPLTNIAKAILKAPDSMRKIGGIVMMGGEFVHQCVEWNILCDFDAAKTVFESDISIVSFGYEVTSQLQFTDEQNDFMMNLQGEGVNEYLGQLCRLWDLSKNPKYNIMLHDVTVIRYALDEQYMDIKEIPVSMLSEGKGKGITLNLTYFWWIPPERKIRIGYNPDVNEFLSYFIKIVERYEDMEVKNGEV